MKSRLYFAIGLLLASGFVPATSRACTPGGTTFITNYEPQVAVAGITRIYVIGGCFGPSNSPGTVSINGTAVPSGYVFMWGDGEIGFVVPPGAQTGALTITSRSYGSDSSTNEANCKNWGWCGFGVVNADLDVVDASEPSFTQRTDPVGPSVPQYVAGTWDYDDGWGDTATYTVTQGPQNSDGSYSLSGSVEWWFGGDPDPCDQNLTGELGAAGVLKLDVEDGSPGCGSYSEWWLVLGSGDITSQGYFASSCQPPAEFPQDLAYGGCADLPLLKSATVVPAGESPTLLGWVGLGGSAATYGAWERGLPLSSGGFSQFSGRVVFEQYPPAGEGAGVDGCYVPGNKTTNPFTGISGGAWYVNSSNVWGSGHTLAGGTDLSLSDDIGIPSSWVAFYEGQYGTTGCSIVVPQTMNIDTVDGPTPYNTAGSGTSSQLGVQVYGGTSKQVCTSVTPQGGNEVQACETYPSPE